MHASATTSQDSSDCSQSKFNLSDCTCTRPKSNRFPPKPLRCAKSDNSGTSSQSDSSLTGLQNSRHRRRSKKGSKLLPLGIYWDIENCAVPKKYSAAAVVQRIRQFFLRNYREAEFLVVCDIKKEKPQIVQELHDAQVCQIFGQRNVLKIPPSSLFSLSLTPTLLIM